MKWLKMGEYIPKESRKRYLVWESMGFKGCIFEGPPPEGFSSWSEWTEADTKTGVKIKALRGQKNSAPDKESCQFSVLNPKCPLIGAPDKEG